MDRPVVLGGTPLGKLEPSPWPIAAGSEGDRLQRVLASGQWAFDGQFEREFEVAFADEQSAGYGVCVVNGTVALQLALEALDVGPGDEVIVPGLTWQATAAAVLDVNATPILVDVEPGTYCIDPDAVETAITDRTRAVIVVHLYDALADLDRILEIGREHGLPVVEDCAHSHGSQWRGKGVGSLGDLGTFSFQTTKSLTAGEGGFVTTNSETLRERVYSLRNCGRRRPGSRDAAWRSIQSGNYRMTEWQSAVLLSQLERFPAQRDTRQKRMHYLDRRLARIAGIRTTSRREQVTRQGLYGYAIRFDEAAFEGLPGTVLRKSLSAELGVELGPPYDPLNAAPLYQPHTKRRHNLSSEYWSNIDPRRFDLPISERARDEAVILPHQFLLLSEANLEIIPSAIDRLSANLGALIDWHRAAVR